MSKVYIVIDLNILDKDCIKGVFTLKKYAKDRIEDLVNLDCLNFRREGQSKDREYFRKGYLISEQNVFDGYSRVTI